MFEMYGCACEAQSQESGATALSIRVNLKFTIFHNIIEFGVMGMRRRPIPKFYSVLHTCDIGCAAIISR
jgi:hypothetical protein